MHYIRSTLLPSKPAQLLIQSGLKWDQDDCPGMAASLSYFALFSLFPMLLVMLSIIGAWIAPGSEAFRQIQEAVERFLPPEVHELIKSTSDLSVFAWNMAPSDLMTRMDGIFAPSIRAFNQCGSIVSIKHAVGLTALSEARLTDAGLEMRAPVVCLRADEQSKGRLAVLLDCRHADDITTVIGLRLTPLADHPAEDVEASD